MGREIGVDRWIERCRQTGRERGRQMSRERGRQTSRERGRQMGRERGVDRWVERGLTANSPHQGSLLNSAWLAGPY